MAQAARTWEPFLDWYGIWPGATAYEADGRGWASELPTGVRLAVQPAARSEPVLVADRPWESTLGYVTVLHDEGRYRMWYGVQTNGGLHPGSALCYAESTDGIHWEKPSLGLMEYNGSTATNIVYPKSVEGSVFRDPAAPPAERYKLVTLEVSADYQGRRIGGDELGRVTKELQDRGVAPADIYGKELRLVGAVHGAVSPDGLRWTQIEEPLFEKFCDTQNVVYYDPERRQYVGYWRSSAGRRRSVARSETDNFRQWPQPEIVLQPDSQDPPTDDLYTNGYSPYPGNANFHLMFPAIYRRVRDLCDVQIAVSRDSRNWSWPERIPVIEPTGDYDRGGIYPGPGLLPLAGDRWGLICRAESAMHNEGYYYRPAKEDGGIGWASWPRDRLVALEAPVEGQVTLNKLLCRGEPLLLNCETEPNGWIVVELIEPTLWPPAHLSAIPGFGFSDCTPVRGDEAAAAVQWNGSSDLSALAGREVCLRIRLYRAKLFAISL